MSLAAACGACEWCDWSCVAWRSSALCSGSGAAAVLRSGGGFEWRPEREKKGPLSLLQRGQRRGARGERASAGRERRGARRYLTPVIDTFTQDQTLTALQCSSHRHVAPSRTNTATLPGAAHDQHEQARTVHDSHTSCSLCAIIMRMPRAPAHSRIHLYRLLLDKRSSTFRR